MSATRDLTVSPGRAQWLAAPLGVLPGAVLLYAFTRCWPDARVQDHPDPGRALLWLAALLGAMLAAVPLHELVHGAVGAWRSGQGFGVVSFGRAGLMPYCHLRVPLRARDYRLMGVAPFVTLGLVPCGVALATGSVFLLVVGLSQVLGAGGDLLVLWLLRRAGADELVRDHPTRVGCELVPGTPVSR